MATQPSSGTAEQRRKAAGNGADRGSARKNGGRLEVLGPSPTGSTQDIHRSPPHSAEAEQGVLGSMLLSPRDVIAECVERINEEYFYIPAHQTIYNVLVDLWNAAQAIDLITFTQVLRDRNLLDAIGGARSLPASILCADGRERRLLPRDRSRQIHPAPNHRGLHRKGAPMRSRTK